MIQSRHLWIALPLLAAGCSEQVPNRPPRPVLVAHVEAAASQEVGPFAGIVSARYTTTAGFRIGGKLINRAVHVGDLVQSGTTLGMLDPTQEKLSVTGAVAGLTSVRAELVNDNGNYERTRILWERGVVPQAQLDLITGKRDTAAAHVKEAEATLLKAQETLGYTILKADFTSVVLEWETEVGQQVAPGQGVVTLARPDVREAEINAPMSLVQKLPASAEFEVVSTGDASLRAVGHLREKGPLADQQTRLQRLKVTLDNPPDALRLGSNVSVTLSPTALPHALVPASAIVEQDGKAYVWIVNGTSRVDLHQVTIITRNENGFSTVDGVGPNVVVVQAGVHSLKPDQLVRVEEGL